MKYWFLTLALAFGFSLMAPPVQVQADSDGGSDGGSDHSGRGTKGGSVPELDPTAAGAGMVLLLGGVAYMASRRREDDAS